MFGMLGGMLGSAMLNRQRSGGSGDLAGSAAGGFVKSGGSPFGALAGLAGSLQRSQPQEPQPQGVAGPRMGMFGAGGMATPLPGRGGMPMTSMGGVALPPAGGRRLGQGIRGAMQSLQSHPQSQLVHERLLQRIGPHYAQVLQQLADVFDELDF